MRRNPLVGWETHADTSALRTPFRVLLQPDAQARFGLSFSKVDFPIYVYVFVSKTYGSSLFSFGIGDVEKNVVSYLREVAKKKNAIVLCVIAGEGSPAKDARSKDDTQLRKTQRITPYTPFTLLHRLHDRISQATGGRFAWNRRDVISDAQTTWLWDKFPGASMYDAEVAAAASKGVDTAAGRAGLLMLSDVLSDLFAKYCLTGKVAYSPPGGDADDRKLQDVYVRELEPYFRELLASLKEVASRSGYVFII